MCGEMLLLHRNFAKTIERPSSKNFAVIRLSLTINIHSQINRLEKADAQQIKALQLLCKAHYCVRCRAANEYGQCNDKERDLEKEQGHCVNIIEQSMKKLMLQNTTDKNISSHREMLKKKQDLENFAFMFKAGVSLCEGTPLNGKLM